MTTDCREYWKCCDAQDGEVAFLVSPDIRDAVSVSRLDAGDKEFQAWLYLIDAAPDLLRAACLAIEALTGHEGRALPGTGEAVDKLRSAVKRTEGIRP